MFMKITFILIGLASALTVVAEDNDPAIEAIIAQLQKRIPSMDVQDVNKSPMKGLYEVMASGQLIYVSADAKFIVSGKLFSIENGIVDLSEDALARIDKKKAPLRQAKIAQVEDKDMIIYKATNEKHKVSVFTDVDCGFCRQLHQKMAGYNNLGITIQYLGYPRAGIGSSSHIKLRSVWCAADQHKAMDAAKIDRTFGTDTCEDPIQEHMQLVRAFGINGTPALILESGRLLPGFVEPANLLKLLEQERAEAIAESKEKSSGS